MGRRLTVARHRRRWGMWTAGVLFVAAVATAVMAFARVGQIDREPWGYIALVIAVVSALGGLFLAFAMAAIESRGD